MNNSNSKMFALEVNKIGFKGVYKGAGTMSEVKADMAELRSKGFKDSEFKVLPIFGETRKEKDVQVVTRTIVVKAPSSDEDELERLRRERSNTNNSGSSTGAFIAGGLVTAGVIGAAYLIHRHNKKKKEKEMEKRNEIKGITFPDIL